MSRKLTLTYFLYICQERNYIIYMPGDNKNDIQQLWDAFLKGDDKAFAAIYFTYAPRLLGYGRKLTSHSALLYDAIQDVFLDIYQKKGKEHRPVANPAAYLFAALRNIILKKKLEEQKMATVQLREEDQNGFDVEYSPQDLMISHEISEENRNRLRQAIGTLSPSLKEIIFLKFEEDFSYDEIARVMYITVESARKQLYRALSSLRKTIDNIDN